ncbi:MAG: 16S rRNA (guanine(527)-N(7))-methyltransferase RsmG [Pseudomonadota bacterium]
MNKLYNRYIELLQKWGSSLDLIGTLDHDEIIEKHIKDCQEITKLISPNIKRVIDFGTGAGLPGLIVKFERPELEIVLLDSKRKKVNFCHHVIAELGLSNITAVQGRVEDKDLISTLGRFDLIVSRATWSLKDFLSKTALFGDGIEIIAMKGPKWKEEINEAQDVMNSLLIRLIEEHHYNLAGGEGRVLLKFKKCFT